MPGLLGTGSGSDLASLKARADSDGDHYVLNGTKIWTTHAHFANRMFLLVRTDDTRQAPDGITFLLLDMDTPGITVSPSCSPPAPTRSTRCSSTTCACPSQRGRPDDQGWTVAKYLLEFERGGGGAAASTPRSRGCAVSPKQTDASGARLIDEPTFARKLDETAVQLEAIQFTEFRIMAAISKGGSPGPESSIMKNLGADMGQYLSELMVEALGFYASAHQPEAREVGQNVPAVGPAARPYRFPALLQLCAHPP